MKHFKVYMLASMLLLSATTLMAQDKYQYATITYAPMSKLIVVSINGAGFEEITVDKGDIKNTYDTNPALIQIAKLNKDGWELFNTSTVGSLTTYVFVLRKKLG